MASPSARTIELQICPCASLLHPFGPPKVAEAMPSERSGCRIAAPSNRTGWAPSRRTPASPPPALPTRPRFSNSLLHRVFRRMILPLRRIAWIAEVLVDVRVGRHLVEEKIVGVRL